MEPTSLVILICGIFLLVIFGAGIRIVRPIEVGLIERLGKFKTTAGPGFSWIIPIIDRMIQVNMTEQMVDVQPQMVITKDKLNAMVDAVVYYKIKDPKASQYKVNNHKRQLTSLARTTLRAVIGKMTLTKANENRDEINESVAEILDKETNSYGVDILRVEIQKIEPPKDVQNAMNEVVKAEQEKTAAVNFANATETRADGEKRSEIKKAEGVKQGRILEAEGDKKSRILSAEGKAKAIELENLAAEKYFKGNAQTLKQLEVTVDSLKNNAKIVIPEKGELVNVIGELAGVAPIRAKKK